MPLNRIADVNIKGVPFRGGMNTRVDPALLPFGAFSTVYNLRCRRPGFEKRYGTRELHTTGDGTNRVLSLFQLEKSRTSENEVFCQMSDGDILRLDAVPPTQTAAALDDEAHSGTASGIIPASWSESGDLLICSYGSDQHQTYAGSSNYVTGFVVYNDAGSGTDPNGMPDYGLDYTRKVTDGKSTTVAVLDSLDTYANSECLFVCTPVLATALTLTVAAANGNASVASVVYYKSDGTWAAASGESDGTSSGGATLAQTGTLSWTEPTDQVPRFLFGRMGYWIQIRFSAALDAEVEISSCTYTAPFAPLQNMWNGVPRDVVEVHVEGTGGEWSVYAGSSVDLDELPAGDKIVILTATKAEGFYIDVGSTPNTSGGATISTFKYWDGTALTSLGTEDTDFWDHSNGLANSGWLKFNRKSDAQPRQFNGTLFSAYMYEITFNAALDADVAIGIQSMPFYDIDDFGAKGNCSCAWKNRVGYTFNDYPEYIYVSQSGSVNVLNGQDFAILEAGDGRSHPVKSMENFYNELLVFQQEKGARGGCITLFEGHSPTTFGKLILSTKLGTFNQNSTEVVDGVLTSTETEEKVKKLCFFLSRYGLGVTDGRTVSILSDKIQNYFDPNDSNSIRRGYEDHHYLHFDPEHNGLRVGMVTGSSATVVNTFLFYDLTDHEWYFDKMDHKAISCMATVTAGSGNAHSIEIGGGVDDGNVYHLNYKDGSGNKADGNDDNDTAIDAYLELEFQAGGQFISIEEFWVRCKADDTGDITMTVSENDVAIHSSITLDMSPLVASQRIRRHQVKLRGVDGQSITIKLRQATVNQDMYLLDWGMKGAIWEER